MRMVAPFCTFFNVNVPSTSVVAEFFVPTTKTTAPIAGCPASSLITPLTTPACCTAATSAWASTGAANRGMPVIAAAINAMLTDLMGLSI